MDSGLDILNTYIREVGPSSLWLKEVAFERANIVHEADSRTLKSKYHFLKPSIMEAKPPENGEGTSHQSNGVPKDNVPVDDVCKPKVVIFPGENVMLDWKKVSNVGAGLVNLGNTCFMNSVLQCLTYCPPLVNYLLADNEHRRQSCTNFCVACLLSDHIQKCLGNSGSVVKPIALASKLKAVAKQFQLGRQEDAHEYLRHVVESMCRTSIASFESRNLTKLDSTSKETTPFNQIFGGYLRSQVTCLECRFQSDTFDHFMDFMLDVKNVVSIERALERFTKPESLLGDNSYKCAKCRKRTTALKRFSVHRAPNVATIQLKRFEYNKFFGGKITKHVSFPETLDLRPYMSDTNGEKILYKLNGVLVHYGTSCNSGHYFCFVRSSSGNWFLMDDTRVSPVGLNHVLNQNAYILFYIRKLPVRSQMNGNSNRSFTPQKGIPTATTTTNLLPKTPIPKLNNRPKLIEEPRRPSAPITLKWNGATKPSSNSVTTPSCPVPIPENSKSSPNPPNIESKKPKVLVPYEASDSSDEEEESSKTSFRLFSGIGPFLPKNTESKEQKEDNLESAPADKQLKLSISNAATKSPCSDIDNSASLSSLGTSVTTWDGKANNVDGSQNDKKVQRHDSDDELDVGKIKKIKTHHEFPQKRDGNPFDNASRFYNHKNNWRQPQFGERFNHFSKGGKHNMRFNNGPHSNFRRSWHRKNNR